MLWEKGKYSESSGIPGVHGEASSHKVRGWASGCRRIYKECLAVLEERQAGLWLEGTGGEWER